MRSSYLFTSESVSEGHPDKVADQISDAIVDLFLSKDPEARDLMPATLDYSHKILMKMAEDRHSGRAPFLEPDAKSQVTLRFENGKPVAATAIVVSTQHKPGYDEGAKETELHDYVKSVVAEVLPANLLNDWTVYHINATGSFEIGGPEGVAGITGRKIIVDTYGGAAPP